MGVRQDYWTVYAGSRKYQEDDIAAVWEVCTEECFAPISTWPEGTVRRILATELCQHWLTLRLLNPAAGPYPAKWVRDGYELAREELWKKGRQ
jgi:hypothetical protein